jgi:glycosyltransferase involved in cell wall biosynthesis
MKARVLVGTVEVGGQLPVYADAFRRLGHEVTSACRVHNPFFPDLKYDVDLSRGAFARLGDPARGRRWPLRALARAADGASLLARALRLIARHDLFVFQWAGLSLLPYNWEYPLLKRLGKRIIAVCNGDDIRHWSAYDQQNRLLNVPSPPLRDVSTFYATDPLTRPLHGLRMAEAHADLVLSVPNQSALALRPYRRFFYVMELHRYTCHVPGRRVPVVVHAPSHKAVKGTEQILAALDRLRAEGVEFELRLLHGVPNQAVLEELRGADVAIDQLLVPPYGLFGAEAMASGCAVASNNRPELETYPPDRPVWHIDPANLHSRLRRLLTDPALRQDLARRGREYVERHHDHVAVTRRMLEDLDDPAADRCHYRPEFFARHYRLPEGVTVPPYLKRLTARVVRRWGLPPGVDPGELVSRGLMDPLGPGVRRAVPEVAPRSARSAAG